MSFLSMKAVGYLSLGLKVRSVTAPDITLRILVRTKAAPLPGFTCWNSIMEYTFPSISKVTPFLKSPAVTIVKTSRNILDSLTCTYSNIFCRELQALL